MRNHAIIGLKGEKVDEKSDEWTSKGKTPFLHIIPILSGWVS